MYRSASSSLIKIQSFYMIDRKDLKCLVYGKCFWPPPKPRWQNPTGCRSVRRGLDDIPVGGTSPSKVVSKRQTHKTTVDPKMYVPVQQRPIYDSQLYLQYPTSVRRIEL